MRQLLALIKEVGVPVAQENLTSIQSLQAPCSSGLVSYLRSSLNKSPGHGSSVKVCHPESFDCHSEQSEESQNKLREGSQIG